MQTSKINWKLNFANPEKIRPNDFFKVFNTWIPDSSEVFVDVADYSHVVDGPWTVLVGHYVDYWLDHTDRQLGFLYNRRRGLENDSQVISKTFKEFIQACIRLEKDPIFENKLKLNTGELLWIINDRALAPNTEETWNHIKPELEKILSKVFGNNNYSMKWRSDSQQRFSVVITLKSKPFLQDILKKIS